VRTTWSSNDLAVYGDRLLKHGDPRGELIALDLRPLPDREPIVFDRMWMVTMTREEASAWNVASPKSPVPPPRSEVRPHRH